MKNKISREKLNSLYCEYYGLMNDSLKLHYDNDKVVNKKAQRSILFLDEINRAPLDTLQASLQLVLDRRLNDHILPIIDGKPTLVVSAINPADGGYATTELDPALMDRFVFAEVEPHAPTWLEWARKNDVAPVIRDFITEFPDRLHYTSESSVLSATPRSWTSLSSTIKQVSNIDDSVFFSLLKGHLGTEISSQFYSFYQNYSSVIKMADIEKLIKAKSKTLKTVSGVAKHVAELIKNQESSHKSELAMQFYEKYATKDTAQEAQPLLVFLNALDVEILTAILHAKREEDIQLYMKVAEFDQELEERKLFHKLQANIEK